MKKRLYFGIGLVLFGIFLLLTTSCGRGSGDGNVAPSDPHFQVKYDKDANTMTVVFPKDASGNFTGLVESGKITSLPGDSYPEPNLENVCEGGFPEAGGGATGLPGKFEDGKNVAVFKLSRSGGIGLPALILRDKDDSKKLRVFNLNFDLIDLEGPIIKSKEKSDGLLYWGTAQKDGQINPDFTCENSLICDDKDDDHSGDNPVISNPTTTDDSGNNSGDDVITTPTPTPTPTPAPEPMHEISVMNGVMQIKFAVLDGSIIDLVRNGAVASLKTSEVRRIFWNGDAAGWSLADSNPASEALSLPVTSLNVPLHDNGIVRITDSSGNVYSINKDFVSGLPLTTDGRELFFF